MTCSSVQASTSTLIIKRLDEKNGNVTLADVHDNSIIHHVIHNIRCNMMGTYACENEHGDIVFHELGLYNCNPVPCEDDKKRHVIFAAVNKTAKFNLCIVAFPNISNSAFVDNITINTKESKRDTWSWTFQSRNFNTHMAEITVANITREDYREHRLTIFLAERAQMSLEFNLILRKPGRPDCPTNIHSSTRGKDYVTLSWTQGLDGGSDQRFSVLYKAVEGHEAWNEFGSFIEGTTMMVTGLTPNTSYNFTVVPGNKDFGENKICKDQAFSLTKTTKALPTPHMKCTAAGPGNLNYDITCTTPSSVLDKYTSIGYSNSDLPAEIANCSIINKTCSSVTGYEVTLSTTGRMLTSKMRITEIGRNDKSRWECSFITEDGDEATNHCELEIPVLESPNMTCPNSAEERKPSSITCFVKTLNLTTFTSLTFKRPSSSKATAECNRELLCYAADGYEASVTMEPERISSTLHIKHIFTEDDGQWQCFVKFIDGDTRRGHCSLTVVEKTNDGVALVMDIGTIVDIILGLVGLLVVVVAAAAVLRRYRKRVLKKRYNKLGPRVENEHPYESVNPDNHTYEEIPSDIDVGETSFNQVEDLMPDYSEPNEILGLTEDGYILPEDVDPSRSSTSVSDTSDHVITVESVVHDYIIPRDEEEDCYQTSSDSSEIEQADSLEEDNNITPFGPNPCTIYSPRIEDSMT